MDRKVWVFAAVGFVGALAMHSTSSNHSAAVDGGRLNRLARLNALMDEGKVEYKPSFFKKRIHAHVNQEMVAGLDPVKSVTEVAPIAPVKDTKAEDAKKAAEKKAADKKKEDAKKKKKKKKKAGDTTPDAQTSSDDKDEKKSDDQANDTVSGGGGVAAAAAPTGPVDPANHPELLTVDQWMTYLSSGVSFDKTSKFIQLAQLGIVRSDIFYGVVERMLLSDVELLHGYAAMALDSKPDARSFEMLFAIGNEESMSQKVKSQASSFLSHYKAVGYARFLVQAAAVDGDPEMSDHAISILKNSVAENIRLGATSPSQPGELGTERSPASEISLLYAEIAQSLQTIASGSSNTNVASNANLAAQAILSLVKPASAVGS